MELGARGSRRRTLRNDKILGGSWVVVSKVSPKRVPCTTATVITLLPTTHEPPREDRRMSSGFGVC